MSTLSQELDRYLTHPTQPRIQPRTEERILRNSSPSRKGRTPSTSAPLCSCDGRSRLARRTSRHGRAAWEWFDSLPSGCTAWIPKHEVPPQALIPSRIRRPRPYIYSEEEIRRIVEVAAELPSINGIRALTYSTLFGLIAVTGLRVSEALSLDAADVDLEDGVLTLRRGKLGKARLLPVADCTTARLADYAKERDRLLGRLPLRSSSPITANVSPTAALDTTSPSSARRSDCGRRKGSTGMGVVRVFMICVTPSLFARC